MNLVLQDLEKNVQEKLQDLARRHGRSMEEEAREILRNAVTGTATVERGLGSQIVARFSGSGISMDEEIPELRGHPVVPPEFET